MKVLLAHNYYQQPGGEDQVFAAEAQLLERYGHRVNQYKVYNDQISELNKMFLATATIWNAKSYRCLRKTIQVEEPDVLHFHNTFPLISPAGYYAAKAEKRAVVQTLHNYRLMCPASTFFRDGGVCEDCMGKAVPWPGTVHACYRNSRAASGVVTAMLAFHRLQKTWATKVDAFIALTEFARKKLIAGGLPEERVYVKPNFLSDDPGKGAGSGGGYALFVGRLAPEKGISVLLSAWRSLHAVIPLKIVGDGPLGSQVTEEAELAEGIEWLGFQSRDSVLSLMREATLLIFPSIWYEAFPMTLIEAFATGLPVVASNLGSLSSILQHGRTGLHFRPGHPEELVAQVKWAVDHPSALSHMREEARNEYEMKYTAERNYPLLMEIYEKALEGGR